MKISVLFRLLLLLMIPGAGHAGCVADRITNVSLLIIGGTIAVPVEVNGQAAVFILDTGAQRSVVTADAVRRLGLARDPWVGTTLSGIGGIDRRANADPRSLSLGGVPLARRTLNHDTSLTVGILPRAAAGNVPIDGLLGRDFLSRFDLDLDSPGHRMTLYQVQECAGRFLPWTGNYAGIPVTAVGDGALILRVTIDDRPLRAMLDTGASGSLLAAPGIYRLGLNAQSLSGDPAADISGLGERVLSAYRHKFHTMRVGDQLIESPQLWVEPVRATPPVDMLLGADWLLERRVWISFATTQVFEARP